MKKTDEELDKLHEIVMRNLYEIFEDEMNVFFKFKRAALDVMGFGKMTFPFSTDYDCAIDHIDKSLDVIEKNISDHIISNLELILEGGKEKSDISNPDSEELKKQFSERIRSEIKRKGLG